MEERKPLVSVIMPAYNAEKYIEAAIRSVLSQSLAELELLVVDDCSADGTREIVRGFEQQDSRVRLIEAAKNQGPAHARNLGMAQSRGAYIALLDCDDLWYPTKLEKQVELLKRERADLVYCSYAIVDENGKPCCQDFLVPAQTDLESMLVSSVISCSTVLLSRELCDRHQFSTAYYHEDYAYWLELLKEGCKAAGCTEILAQYRVLRNSRSFNKWKSAVNRWRIYRDYLKLPFPKCAVLMLRYAAAGLRKYRKSIGKRANWL